MVKTGFSSNLSNARNVDSVPGGGPKILDAVQKKKKKVCRGVSRSVYTPE